MNNFLKVPEMSQKRLNWVGIVPTDHIQPTKVAGTRIKGPKSLSQNCPNFVPVVPIWFQKSGFINSVTHYISTSRYHIIQRFTTGEIQFSKR